MGVTITAVGALAVTNANSHGASSTTLAVEALRSFSNKNGGAPPPDQIAIQSLVPSDSLAVGCSIVLVGLFLLIAAALTFLQEKRSSTWIPGLS
jgi:hypothetical protein